ncbi:MAG: hypothetical protein HKP61_00700 [Dactylosporangium sp.]|nr:hypothetical protein [Dactylosporangium sp.]NNJ59488.1 hypothetical protein [Dactylosporangium sp.]
MSVASPKGALGPYGFVWDALCVLGAVGEDLVSADVDTFDQATGLGATLRDGMSWVGAGEAWPSGDEDQLRQLAQLWVRLAGDINEYVQTADAGAMAAQLAWAGPAAEAFGAVWQQLGVSPQAGLPAMMNAAVAFGQGCDAAAMELEYCKLTVVISVYITVFAVFAALISAYWSFGTSTAAVPPILAAGRQAVMVAFRQVATQLGREILTRQAVKLAVKQAAKQAIKTIARETATRLSRNALKKGLLWELRRELIEEIGEELIIDVGAQAIQGHRGTRTEWDYQRTATAGLGGGIGAVLGIGMHKGFAGFKKFKRWWSESLDAVTDFQALPNLVRDQVQRQARKTVMDKVTEKIASNPIGRWTTNTLQAGAYNSVISPVSSMLANKVVYGGDWEIPDAEAFLGGFMGGAGRVGLTGPATSVGNYMGNVDLNSICNSVLETSVSPAALEQAYLDALKAAGIPLSEMPTIDFGELSADVSKDPFTGHSWSSVAFNPLRDFGQEVVFPGADSIGDGGFQNDLTSGGDGGQGGQSTNQARLGTPADQQNQRNPGQDVNSLLEGSDDTVPTTPEAVPEATIAQILQGTSNVAPGTFTTVAEANATPQATDSTATDSTATAPPADGHHSGAVVVPAPASNVPGPNSTDSLVDPDQSTSIVAPGVVESAQVDLSDGLIPPSVQDQQALEQVLPHDSRGRPVPHPDPRTGRWVRLVNGFGIAEEGRCNNCSEAARAFLACWYGTPTVASSVASGLLAEPDALGRDQAHFGAEYTHEGTGVQAYGAVINRLELAGHGAAAVIVTQWTAEVGGGVHTWNAVNHNGGIVFVDAQAGTVTTDGPIHPDGVANVWSIVLDAAGHPAGPDATAGSASAEPVPATTTGTELQTRRTNIGGRLTPGQTSENTLDSDLADGEQSPDTADSTVAPLSAGQIAGLLMAADHVETTDRWSRNTGVRRLQAIAYLRRFEPLCSRC